MRSSGDRGKPSPGKGGVVEIALRVPAEVKDAFRSLYAIAEHDSAIRGRLREWMEDRHGPVLAARGYSAGVLQSLG